MSITQQDIERELEKTISFADDALNVVADFYREAGAAPRHATFSKVWAHAFADQYVASLKMLEDEDNASGEPYCEDDCLQEQYSAAVQAYLLRQLRNLRMVSRPGSEFELTIRLLFPFILRQEGVA